VARGDFVLCWHRARADHDRLMKKVLAAAAALVGVGVLARLVGPKMGSIDWEKRSEAMPGSAPPKWMFRNITAIRDNTGRILQLLEPGHAEPAPHPPPPPDH
jgi:hypothetical protein